MRIFLVRHGQSLSNVDLDIHKTMPDHAIPLSPKGEEQAKEAGNRLAELLPRRNPEHVRLWVSPYKRTRQTAEGILSACPMIFDSREHVLLCEQQFGLFDGVLDEELPKRFPEEYRHYVLCERFEGRFWARMPMGESRFDVAQRVHQSFGTFHRDKDRHGIGTIVVVCHGVTLRAFVMMWCHLTPEWFEAERNPKNCAIRLIENGIDRGYL